MFCRNCGEAMNDNQAICLKCGVKTGEGTKFCQNCGQEVAENAEVCLSCGVALKKASASNEPNLNGRDKIVTALLAFFLGGLGIHNFYMGETKKGVLRIVLSLLCGIGGIIALIDFVKILIGSYTYNPEAYF